MSSVPERQKFSCGVASWPFLTWLLWLRLIGVFLPRSWVMLCIRLSASYANHVQGFEKRGSLAWGTCSAICCFIISVAFSMCVVKFVP